MDLVDQILPNLWAILNLLISETLTSSHPVCNYATVQMGWVILVTYTDVIYHSFRIGMFVGTNVMCYLFSLAGMGVLFGLKLWKLFFKDVLLCEIKIWMVYKFCKTGFKTSCWVIFLVIDTIMFTFLKPSPYLLPTTLGDHTLILKC